MPAGFRKLLETGSPNYVLSDALLFSFNNKLPEDVMC